MARTAEDKKIDKTVGDILATQQTSKMISRGEDEDKMESLRGGTVDAAKLKTAMDKIMAAIERANQANADVKSAYERAENQGFDKRSLKRVIKHKVNAESDEHRITVNAYMKALGELPLFAMPEAH